MWRRTGVENVITLQDSSSSISNTLADSFSKFQISKLRRKWQFRTIGSRSVLLILTWQFLITCSLGFTTEALQSFELGQEQNALSLQDKTIIGIIFLSCTLLPVSSLLAEVITGRYKLVSYSLRLMWLFSIVAVVTVICEESLHVKQTVLHFLKLFLILPQYLILEIFLANSVPLGIDQIVGGTNNNISSFIQWLSWALYSGFAIADAVGSVSFCALFQKGHVRMIFSLLSVLLLSVGLILDFCFHHKLVKEPVTVNPVSLIFSLEICSKAQVSSSEKCLHIL